MGEGNSLENQFARSLKMYFSTAECNLRKPICCCCCNRSSSPVRGCLQYVFCLFLSSINAWKGVKWGGGKQADIPPRTSSIDPKKGILRGFFDQTRKAMQPTAQKDKRRSVRKGSHKTNQMQNMLERNPALLPKKTNCGFRVSYSTGAVTLCTVYKNRETWRNHPWQNEGWNQMNKNIRPDLMD